MELKTGKINSELKYFFGFFIHWCYIKINNDLNLKYNII